LAPSSTGIKRRLDDDVFELADVGKPSLGLDDHLEILRIRRRLLAELAGGHLDVLLGNGVDHVLGGQVVGLDLVRVEPDAHAVLVGAVDVAGAHARYARDFVAHAQVGVVGDEQVVEGAVRRLHGDGQEHGRGFFLHRDALALHFRRQAGQALVDPVLDQDGGDIQVGADVEGHGQGVGTVAGAL